MRTSLQTAEGSVQPGSRVKRLLQLLWILQGNQGWHCSRLAEHFQVSRRTIFRDIQILRDSGIPIHSSGSSIGYQLSNNSLFRCPELEAIELFALKVMHTSPELAKVQVLHRAAEVAVAKLMNAVSGRVRSRVELMNERLKDIVESGAGISSDLRKLDSFLESCLGVATNQR
ncbi:Bifunctional ligase/repressor BirA [Anatilimnocola aggregata]|uniref:Bifunctional ligase/repressor BirA n=1 Tax=Anatilimnocola aggregata TaxID=2528021 RepID=A0A517Y7K1_9BACT|nr:Bifunctional ligase/repressor BirA [Anatilimnocola aggregata]